MEDWVWTEQQQAAIDKATAWLAEGREPIFRLSGHAGSGKSVMSRALAATAKRVKFCAPTGKAAARLRDLGCPNSTTVHRLIYTPVNDEEIQLLEVALTGLQELFAQTEDPTEKARLSEKERVTSQQLRTMQNERGVKFVRNEASDLPEADLVVVDESSMVSSDMAEDLCSFNVPVLALGDPAQLPPVQGVGFFSEKPPDVLLTDVHRQALGSPILGAATAVRTGKSFMPYVDGDALRYVRRGERMDDDYVKQTQIVCGRNATRYEVNRRVRDLLGFGALSPYPVVGDRIICKRNDYKQGLLNGDLFVVEEVGQVWKNVIALVVSQGMRALPVLAQLDRFVDGTAPLRSMATPFEFSYGITVHAAQGSQWDELILLDENYCFKANKTKWLYTGITRAAKRLTIVQT